MYWAKFKKKKKHIYKGNGFGRLKFLPQVIFIHPVDMELIQIDRIE